MRSWQKISLIILSIVSLIAGFFVTHEIPKGAEHESLWWNEIYIFYALFGFIGCLVIILFGKTIGKKILQRKEDYFNGI